VIRVRLEGDRADIAVENAARDADTARIALLREMEVRVSSTFASAKHWMRSPIRLTPTSRQL
jgi:hypothetical protein